MKEKFERIGRLPAVEVMCSVMALTSVPMGALAVVSREKDKHGLGDMWYI